MDSLPLGEFEQRLEDALVDFMHSFIHPSNHPSDIFQVSNLRQVLD